MVFFFIRFETRSLRSTLRKKDNTLKTHYHNVKPRPAYFINAESELLLYFNWTWDAGSESDKAQSGDAVLESDRAAEVSRHVANNSR